MFEVEQIAPHTWEFLDEGQDSFYLVTGEHTAAVIDTGITMGGRILPEIRRITQLPVILVLTHAHHDHLHHMDEFSTVYMCHEELALPGKFLQEMMKGKALDLSGTKDIRTGSCIDLGGRRLEICQVPGHTPGSVAIWEASENLLFTGDAIGSGCGVWMQLPGSLPLVEYVQNLRIFMRWLVERGGRMRFFGGHNRQPRYSKQIPGFNPISLGLLADLIDLAEGVADGRIIGTPCDAPTYSDETALYAAFGRAEMIYRGSNIRD